MKPTLITCVPPSLDPSVTAHAMNSSARKPAGTSTRHIQLKANCNVGVFCALTHCTVFIEYQKLIPAHKCVKIVRLLSDLWRTIGSHSFGCTVPVL